MFTASFGEGHNTAAKAVAEALDRRGVPHSGAVDFLSRVHPGWMQGLAAGYRFAITHTPRMWRSLYQLADRLPMGADTPDLWPVLTRRLAADLSAARPRAVVSTYPLYGHLIDRLFGTAPLPFALVTVVTDSSSINASWLNAADGHYAVADEGSAAYFENAGIERGRIHVTGFPVRPAFGAQRPRDVETELPRPLRILYTPTTSKASVRRALGAIRALDGAELTVVLGRHERRLRRTVEAVAPPDATILGWTDQMAALLARSHLVIGKAGGASTQEALASACPMLIDAVVPGQEEGNAELLESAGAGRIAVRPGELETALSALFDGGGGGWLSMRAAAIRSGRPGAAGDLVDLVLRLSPASP